MRPLRRPGVRDDPEPQFSAHRDVVASPCASRAIADRCEGPMVDRAYFEALTDRFRSPHLWQKDPQGWRLRRTAWMEN